MNGGILPLETAGIHNFFIQNERKQKMPCEYYREAPKCPECGAYTALLDRDTRFCPECEWKITTTDEDKKYWDRFTQSPLYRNS